MPTEQPSNAPQGDTPHPADDLTAAAVLSDDSLDRPAGGGGLLPGAVGGETPGQAGAETRNSPMSAGLARDSDGAAEAEARHEAVANAPAEPGHGSQ